MRHHTLAITLSSTLAVCLFSTGCRNGGFRPTGPMLQQQSQAIINDPFLQNDIAPYEAASRPPSYQQPRPEAVRNRMYRDATFGFGR